MQPSPHPLAPSLLRSSVVLSFLSPSLPCELYPGSLSQSRIFAAMQVFNLGIRVLPCLFVTSRLSRRDERAALHMHWRGGWSHAISDDPSSLQQSSVRARGGEARCGDLHSALITEICLPFNQVFCEISGFVMKKVMVVMALHISFFCTQRR